MKYIVSILAIMFFQSQKIITLEDYYCGKGVIFDEKSNYPFLKEDYEKPITPTIDNIKLAEDILFDKYYIHRVNVLKRFEAKESLIPQKYKKAKSVKKKFNKYYRQYAGFVNRSKDTIIYIGLFDFSNKKQARQYFERWDQLIFLGTGDFYYNHQEHYEINISKNEITH
ncbi:MAG TPA: hypothetical protein VF677_08520 [Flavobacterium sp.]